jgi:N-hydroxyarylamine O-acetyltransferase
MFDVESYLARVGLSAPPSADVEGMRRLHAAQFYSIPFENFDIQLGRSIQLDLPSLQQKLVLQARGGYCFELNGLMLHALRAFGFKVRPILARVHLQDPPTGLTHQVNAVEIEGQTWIQDVGFGAGGLRGPLLLSDGASQQGPGVSFRHIRQEPWGWVMQSRVGRVWKNSASFELGHFIEADLEVGNHYTSTSPNTHFTQIRVASLPLASGRISLRDCTRTSILDGKTTTEQIKSASAYLALLKSDLGIEFDAETLALWRKKYG